MGVKVTPQHASINAAKELAEPWVELWSGDEWGEIMSSLAHTIHSDYGLSDDDLAILAEMLWRNLERQRKWVDHEGHEYGIPRADGAADVQARCRAIRDEYLAREQNPVSRGSLDSLLAVLPDWVFG